MSRKKSGNNGRPELNNAMEYLRAGDKLVIYKIERMARPTRDLHVVNSSLAGLGSSQSLRGCSYYVSVRI
ncbi:hypothetical protein E2K98_24275 [Bacillus salipaludis]|uniref:Resolvase/invertase-type recombinase catalytic domain-containing protein n=1 Tax=Bacillus salipaludis TaxID=2547811 RepID=A0A4R5VKK3_9BACI|nr:hypothetical protein E2K98_24275 [Bacillus salipaludis]